ncbi:MAG: formylglycine-generating enzyme family protein [Flammeovirgaceae bacterium]|nr:formylglycine-generating enzyme family protein [Flammeovirgaceae bacterium]MDW8288022.1 SUMF1/EgtB/PvdO family nonheme iron enzyme [Flammeovirgaceae bacterium]
MYYIIILLSLLFWTTEMSLSQEKEKKKEKAKKEKRAKKHHQENTKTEPSLEQEAVKQSEETNKPQTKEKKDFFEMVYIPAGSFKMGHETGEKMDKPVHEVELDEYWIGKYEVTQAQWVEIMGENPSGFPDCPQCPIENVNYDDILKFIEKVNERSGYTYRLPTEAEWEYAARGGSQSKGYKFSGSNNINEVGWYWENSAQKTHPVGQKKPNELGLYDMTGNVAEWCADWYSDDYYTRSPRKNPQGEEKGVLRSVRGGSWEMDSRRSIVWHRNSNVPVSRNEALGFRLVRGKE